MDNLRFDDFDVRKSMIQVLQNGKEIFYGEVREVTKNFDFTKHIYAVGELAFFFDSIQPQKVYKCTPREMFVQMIQIHNSQVEPRKRFEIGEVSVTDPNNYVYHFTNREDTLTALREKLCKTLNGYLKITKSNGKRYINLVPLERYGVTSTQKIEFGENLIDFVANETSVNIATSIIPLGAMLEENERTARAVTGLDEYVTIVGTKADAYHKNINDDFLINDEAVSRFGNVRVTKTWNDVHDPDILKDKALKWLKEVQYSELILDLSAFDLNLMDVNIDSYNLGDKAIVWALPFGMENISFPVQKKTIHMTDLEKNRMVLGSSYIKSYTSQASEAVNAVFEEIPETTPILKNAKDNSRKILEGTEGGHVLFRFDDKGDYITEEMICDGASEEQSLRKWVWNLGGFGYLKRSNLKDKWTDLGVAITMDGAIVADYITAGVMSANRVRGGEFAVGGTGFAKDGSIKIYDSKNALIGKWDKSGIGVYSGTIQSGNYSKDNDKEFSNAGTNIDLSKGSFISKNFIIKEDGSSKFRGSISATSGTIGSNADESKRWQIGDTGIYNGCKSINDNNAGTFISKDGFRNYQSPTSVTTITGGQLSTNNISATGGSIGGFTLGSNNLHSGTSSDGIWIQGGAGYGCPKGMVAVGVHGYGLIRLGYMHNNRIGIVWEVNDYEKYFVDLYEIGQRI